MTEIGRPRAKRRLPVVLTPDELAQVLCFLEGEHRLFAQLLYGTGMRINEGLQLRVKDIDFGRGTIIVREGKGGKDRAVMLPQRLIPGLREQLARARILWAADQEAGRGGVAMPDALDRKYPRAGASWTWFWVFPRIRIPLIRALEWFAGTTCTTKRFKERSNARCHPLALLSPPPHIPFAILLRRLYYRPAMTSVRCKSCFAMLMWQRP